MEFTDEDSNNNTSTNRNEENEENKEKQSKILYESFIKNNLKKHYHILKQLKMK